MRRARYLSDCTRLNSARTKKYIAIQNPTKINPGISDTTERKASYGQFSQAVTAIMVSQMLAGRYCYAEQ